MSSHRSGIDRFNREHASRNAGAAGAGMSHPVGGSAKFTQPARTAKSPSMGGSSDAKALGRVAKGKIETMRGKNVS